MDITIQKNSARIPHDSGMSANVPEPDASAAVSDKTGTLNCLPPITAFRFNSNLIRMHRLDIQDASPGISGVMCSSKMLGRGLRMTPSALCRSTSVLHQDQANSRHTITLGFVNTCIVIECMGKSTRVSPLPAFSICKRRIPQVIDRPTGRRVGGAQQPAPLR